MGLREDITARAIESGRTFDQQAAYDRLVGDASTVAAQQAMLANEIEAEGVDVDACIDCAQHVAGISEHERGEEYPTETKRAAFAYGMRLVSGDCGDENERHTTFTRMPCGLCGSTLAGERCVVTILPA